MGSGPKDTDEYMRWWETEQTATERIGNKIQSNEASEKKVIWAEAKKDM